MSSLIADEQHLRTLLGIDFTPAQMEAITAGLDRPVAVIAGAGSGKTAVMAARVVWLVGHEGIAPERILGLTFTNKAAAELGQRIRASLDRLGIVFDGDPLAATYHAFAGTLIAEHGLRLGLEPDRRIVTDASRFQRIARAVETYPSTLDHASTHVPTLVGHVAALDSQLSEHLVDPGELRDFDRALIQAYDPSAKLVAVVRDAAEAARKRTDLGRLVEAYRSYKDDDGVLDFSDQMAAGALLARQPAVRQSLRERFDVVLLDEYQDTSVAQRDLLRDLFDGMPVTAVGDPAQGIYGWRGAATGNLKDFLNDFRAADGSAGRRLSLAQTRRCAPQVIEAANMIAKEFYESDSTVTPLTSAKPAGGRVDVGLYRTVGDEVAAVVAQVGLTHDAGVPWRKIAILVRVARENGAIVAALRAAGIPFEIVGLNGLLELPEIVDLTSLLQITEDATANPAVLRLLSGPRWNVGPRDLALLGRRAASLAHRPAHDDAERSLEAELARAVEGTDPTDVVSLADALGDLGELGYSLEARGRFGELAVIIDGLRRHAGDPLVDLARRAVRALDLDIELEASQVAGGSDNLATFLDAVAQFAQSDRHASLGGLMAYLRAESDFNEGMEVRTPSESDSIKLLTIHRAKGLEWHTVFVPLVSASVFPSTLGRGNWVTSPSTIPGPLRGDAASLAELAEWTPKGFTAFKKEAATDAAMEERRLAYVAYTRAEERLVLTGHWWGRTQKNVRGPSEYLLGTRDWLARQGIEPLAWAEQPDDETNPHFAQFEGIAWPVAPACIPFRVELAAQVVAELAGELAPGARPVNGALAARFDELESDIAKLLAESDARHQAIQSVSVPASLSTTAMLALVKDPGAYARNRVRPMPRRPSSAARFGTRFHAWVEAHFGHQGVLLDPEDLPGRGDVDIESDAELDEVIARFRQSAYADRTPVAIEAPFSLVLGGQQIVGQIDAVFAEGDRFEVVDWKTNRDASADPLQLAVYRLAWAELRGVPTERVGASFYYVRLGTAQVFDRLPDRAELETLLSGDGTVLG